MSEARRQNPAIPQTCGCGEELGVATPQAIDNRIGLPAIAGRIGNYGSLRQTLLARLTLSHEPALAKLTSRDERDFSIGLLESQGHPQGFVVMPIYHFVDCILDGKEPATPAEDGLAATQIIEAIERSIEQRRTVEIGEV